MSARADIIETITRLFVATDNREWAAVRACFADHVHFDMTSLAGGEPATLSPEQIISGWQTGLAPMESVHHQAGNFIVNVHVNGVEANAFCYGIAYHYRRTKSGRNTRVFVGSYDFHLVLAHTEWKINRFRFNAKFIDGNLELEKD